jgi:hypothetical protein
VTRGDGPFSTFSALLTWCAWLFGFGGIHRLYLGKTVTGVIYLLTWGLLGVGQILDVVHINRLVDEANAKARKLSGAPLAGAALPATPRAKMLASANPEEVMRAVLLEAAAKHGGNLTVTQGVMASGKSFKEVEAALDAMAKSGYVGIDNHPDSGAVIYTFGEL